MGAISQVDQPVNTFDVLDSGVEQLKEEHAVLKSKLSDIYESAKGIGKECTADRYGFLQKLREKVTAFMRELACHSGWEDEVLLPVVADFTGIKKVASMGFDYMIGIQNMKQFLNIVEGLRAVPVQAEDAKRAAACLFKAHDALSDQFRIEEEVLFPMAEEMLTDMEHFFS